MKIKKRYLIPLLLLFLLLVSVAIGVFWYRENSKPVSGDDQKVDFLVVKGRSAIQIANSLYEKKLIRSPLAFKMYVQFKGKSQSIQAGEFKMAPNLALSEIVDELMKGPVELWVTIPEGLRREEIVEKYVTTLEMDETRAEQFRKEFMLLTATKEGSLFPDTYLFPRDVTAEKAVSVITATFDSKLKELGGVEHPEITDAGLLVLASIIERETKTDEERPIVAGIYFNRLEIGMPLQADATVQYAVASAKCKVQTTVLSSGRRSAKCEKWWEAVTKEDLNIDSPYNTYKYSGLPPAPIANPGLSSIKAVYIPSETEYLYYIHDPEGKIHYAETLPEHNDNVRKYLGK